MTIPSPAAEEIVSFIPPERSQYPGALGRYLLPLPANVLDAYINAYTAPGEVLLDPFAHTDAAARAAARNGRKAVLSDLNPLTSFVARTTMLMVTGHELYLAFTRLSEAKQAEAPLASHLDGLYATVCPRCGAEAVASEFVWDRKAGQPILKVCVCKACHFGEEEPAEPAPVTEADLARLEEIEPRGFHYWYVLDRFGREGDERRELAVQMLDLYTPRAVYVLATLLRRIEDGGEGPNMQSVLKLALLECLAACSKLEGEGIDERGRTDIDLRPRPRFRERNVWRRFAEACGTLRHHYESRGADRSPPRLAASMERVLDPSPYGRLGGTPNAIVLRRAARHLAKDLPEDSVSLVITAPPGPAHGMFLCLSYLWSGWLLGVQQARALEQIPCSLRPIDWGDYYRAVAIALRGLRPTLRDGAAVVFAVTAESLRHCDMLVLAGAAAGLHLDRILCQPVEGADPEPAQSEGAGYYYVVFRNLANVPTEAPGEVSAGAIANLVATHIDKGTQDVLALRAEPTVYAWLHLAVLEELGRANLLLPFLAERGFDGVAAAQALDDEITGRLERAARIGMVVQWETRPPAWALARPQPEALPLSDRVEWAVYTLLSTSRRVAEQNVVRIVHELFPGLGLPQSGWIEECLASYGVRDEHAYWTLRRENQLPQRLSEHSRMIATLVDLGRRFGYKVWISREEAKRPYKGDTLGQLLSMSERFASPTTLFGGAQAGDVDVIWYDGKASTWIFEIEWTAMLSEAIVGRRLRTNARRYLVVWDERVALLIKKLQRLPWLVQRLEEDGWQFIKYRHLRRFAQAEDASQYNIGSIVGLQPVIEQEQGQLHLI
ncbi:MAG: hypothetical protein ACYC1C_18915 [Chloroflexota bacterium]